MYIDTHTHLARYAAGQKERMLDQIESDAIISLSVSMDPDSFLENKKLCRRNDLIFCSFGVHPWQAHLYSDHLETLDKHISQSDTLGEIGLDKRYVDDPSLYPRQQAVFEYQLQKAHEKQKPVNLHTAGAEVEVLEYLKQYSIPNPLVHWYNGPLDLIPEYLDHGCYFSVGVEILFSQNYREVAKAIPIERLLTETDNPTAYPWLKGVGNHGKNPGMPRLVKQVVEELADTYDRSVSFLKHRIYKNFHEFYPNVDKIPPFVKQR